MHHPKNKACVARFALSPVALVAITLLHAYGDPQHEQWLAAALRQTIAQWLARRYGIPAPDEATQVLPVNGTREALFAIAQAVGQAGHGRHRPGPRKGFAPAHRTPGDGHHVQTCSFQVGQGLQGVWRDGAVGGQCVIDVGEDADEALRRTPI